MFAIAVRPFLAILYVFLMLYRLDSLLVKVWEVSSKLYWQLLVLMVHVSLAFSFGCFGF